MMRIAYIGIDLLFPALPALHEAGCEILEIFTCETDNVAEFNTEVTGFAESHGIPCAVGRVCPDDFLRLRKKGCEAVICAGYYYRLPVDIEMPMVNIHPSLLPVGRGAWPMPVTILKALPETGVTIHRLTESFDEGPILMQEKLPVSPGENLQTLTGKLAALLPRMMKKLADDFKGLYKDAIPQGEGEYWPYLMGKHFPITTDTEFDEADRILRAFYGYECVYEKDGESYIIMGGKASRSGGGFPVRGGFISGAKLRRNQ